MRIECTWPNTIPWYGCGRSAVHEEVEDIVTRAVLEVPGISCEHCERTVKATLEPLAGVQTVQVDVPTRSVTVDYDEGVVTLSAMSLALAEENYPVAGSKTN